MFSQRGVGLTMTILILLSLAVTAHHPLVYLALFTLAMAGLYHWVVKHDSP